MPKAIFLCEFSEKEKWKLQFIKGGFNQILEKRLPKARVSLWIFYKTKEDFVNISKIIEQKYEPEYTVENNGSQFSEDEKHRYKLWRIWNDKLPIAMCIGLNPAESDSVIIGVLKRMFIKLGYGGFYMMNLFTVISSNPYVLKHCDDMIFDFSFIKEVSKSCNTIIFAWGAFDEAKNRAKSISRLYQNAFCFGKNKNGTPIHPLGMIRNGMQANPKLIKF